MARLLTKLGLVVSLLFILQAGVSLVWAPVFPETSGRYVASSAQTGSFRAFILVVDTGWVASLLLVVALVSMIATQPRNEWKAWAASVGSAALVSFLNWYLTMEGLIRIVVLTIFAASNLYAFCEFGRHVRAAGLGNKSPTAT